MNTYTPTHAVGKGGRLHMDRPDMKCLCDICGKPRNRSNHDRCSKARQAAGFLQ